MIDPSSKPSGSYVLVIDSDRSRMLKGALNSMLQNQFTNQMFSQALMQMNLVNEWQAFVNEIMEKEHVAKLCFDPNCRHPKHETNKP